MRPSTDDLPTGPLRYELLFAAPNALDLSYLPDPPRAPAFRHGWWRGTVGGDWDRHTFPTGERHKIVACRRRFEDNASWEDSGMFFLMRDRIARSGPFDGCRTEADIRARYEKVDALFERVREEGRLRLRWELDGAEQGERLGIRVHMARDGRLLFAGRGHHRLAIARALRLSSVPVGLVIAHSDAVRNGHLERRRRERADRLEALGLALPSRAIGLPRPLANGFVSSLLPTGPCRLDG